MNQDDSIISTDIGASVMLWNIFKREVAAGYISSIKPSAYGLNGFLAPPHDEHVGAFSLTALSTRGFHDTRGFLICTPAYWAAHEAAIRARPSPNGILSFGSPSGSERAERTLLGLPTFEDLSATQIEKAFRVMTKKVHPDVGGDAETFVKVKQARDVLLSRWEGK